MSCLELSLSQSPHREKMARRAVSLICFRGWEEAERMDILVLDTTLKMHLTNSAIKKAIVIVMMYKNDLGLAKQQSVKCLSLKPKVFRSLAPVENPDGVVLAWDSSAGGE